MKIYVLTEQFLRDDSRGKPADIIPEAPVQRIFTNEYDAFKFLNTAYNMDWDLNYLLTRETPTEFDDLILTRLAGTTCWVVLEDSLGEEYDCSLEGRLTLKEFNV